MTDTTAKIEEAMAAVLDAIIAQANAATNASKIRDVAEAYALVVGSKTIT